MKSKSLNALNIIIMVISIFLMLLPNTQEIMFLGLGLFVPSVFNLLFNGFND